MSQEELEETQRRRSSRIFALEEKKREQRVKAAILELALDEKDKQENKNKDKRKDRISTDEGDDDLMYDFDEDDDDDGEEKEEEEYLPTKKGRKSKALDQLLSSTQPMQEGQHPEKGTTSRTNEPSLKSMPEKLVLAYVLDLLQRKDPDELFAEPIDPDVVEDFYKIVKQPMDFGTMRAKLREDKYTSMNQFKRDVYLMCVNAMIAIPANTPYHKVAEAIKSHAKVVFDGLSDHHGYFALEFSLNKKLQALTPAAAVRKPQAQGGGQSSRTSRNAKLPPRPPGFGRNLGTLSTVPEIERRYTYKPPYLSAVPNAPKPNLEPLQLNQNAGSYQDSLQRFVEDLGPTAQTFATKKLETVKFKQLLIGEISAADLLANVQSQTQITTLQPTTPQAPPTQPNNAPNKPLTIPGASAAAPETRNVNPIAAGSANYKGKMLCVEDGWDACAAAVLGSNFVNNDTRGSSSGLKIGENNTDAGGPDGTTDQNREVRLLGANITGKCLMSTNTKDFNAGSSGQPVRTRVWPTLVISGNQTKPLLGSKSGNNLSEQSSLHRPRPAESMLGINNSGLSLFNEPKPANSMHGINNSGQYDLNASLVSQPKPAKSIYDLNVSLVPRPKPTDQSMYEINDSGLSLMSPQPKSAAAESMSGTELQELPLLPAGKSILASQAGNFSKWNEHADTSLYGLDTPYQPGGFQALLMGSTSTDYFNNSPHLAAAQLGQLKNLFGPFPQKEQPKSSSAREMPFGSGMNQSAVRLQDQPGEASSLIVLDDGDDDQQPNLALQL